MMRKDRIRETAVASDNVFVASVPGELLDWVHPYWDALPAAMKCVQATALAGIGGETRHDHNTTCIELDEYRVGNLNPTTNKNQWITTLAIGTSGKTPQYTDRSLNDEIDRTDIAEFVPQGTTLTARIFLAKAEANGSGGTTPTLQELGLYAGENFLNHSTFNGIEKTNQKAIVIEVELTFDTASGDP